MQEYSSTPMDQNDNDLGTARDYAADSTDSVEEGSPFKDAVRVELADRTARNKGARNRAVDPDAGITTVTKKQLGARTESANPSVDEDPKILARMEVLKKEFAPLSPEQRADRLDAVKKNERKVWDAMKRQRDEERQLRMASIDADLDESEGIGAETDEIHDVIHASVARVYNKALRGKPGDSINPGA